MGSTVDSDRKRRHFSTISPTAATPKKQPFLQISEDKKLDIAVLQYQNQKLIQKLETQKVEYGTLEDKFFQLKEKQEPYDATLVEVTNTWEELVNGLETCSVHMKKWRNKQDGEHRMVAAGGYASSFEDAVLSRLAETGATECSSTFTSSRHMEDDIDLPYAKTKVIEHNIVASIENLWYMKDGLHASLLNQLPGDDLFRNKTSRDLVEEVRNLRLTVKDFLLKHKLLVKELQNHQDLDAKNKADLKRLKVELEDAVAELKDSNSKITKLRADQDAAKGAVFPVLNLGGKTCSSGRLKDKQKDLRDLESALKDLKDQAAGRLEELKELHEGRIKMFYQLSNIQNTMKSVKSISSSQAYILLRDQIEKLTSEVFEQQTLFEKLQVEKDNVMWKEKEFNVKTNILDVMRRSSAVSDARINDLGLLIKTQRDKKKLTESKLAEISKESGRKKVVSEFRALVSSFPEAMGTMQSQLHKYKEAASDVHTLRADMQSLSSILDRMVKECERLLSRSNHHMVEIQKLQALVQDLTDCDHELKLILDMYRRESSESREVLEARDLEYKAWARVQCLKSSLDERNLESRVKTANEAEAISQQRLAAAEAEIAQLRQKLETAKRDFTSLSATLKSKGEENVAYLSEIETIGQAYDDMQTQNQHLLQQITERDDYNVKLVLEGLRARQLQEIMVMEKQTLEREIQQANTSLNLYEMKVARIEDQMRGYSEHIQKIEEAKLHDSTTLESTQKRLLDISISSQKTRELLEESQSKVEKNRTVYAELQIELEKERFRKKRIEEELEVVGRKASRLQAQIEGSSIVEKLHEELREYEKIVNCKICVNSRKQVVITKCFHLFCSPCVQDILKSQQRKCPRCGSSFGPNDVKQVFF